MKTVSTKQPSGFTIVELLIVVVVIAILAAVTIVSYRNIQQRARDSVRAQDAKNIEKGLRSYLAFNGNLFSHTTSSWETSVDVPAGQFLSALVTSKVMDRVPVDPVNSPTKHYRYYRYPAGYMGCDATRGAFVIFQVIDMENSGRPAPGSPGFSCPSRDWSNEADYTVGIFEND